VISFQDIEQFIPFIKPLFEGLRSARDFLARNPDRKTDHDIQIPKQTLIVMPEGRINALWWGMGTAAGKPAMQIVGDFQATNTSHYAIRISGMNFIRPRNVEVLLQRVTVEDAKTGMHSSKNFIPKRAIGELRMMFFIAPPICHDGETLVTDISFIDQFNNEHVLNDLRFRHIGPAKQP